MRLLSQAGSISDSNQRCRYEPPALFSLQRVQMGPTTRIELVPELVPIKASDALTCGYFSGPAAFARFEKYLNVGR